MINFIEKMGLSVNQEGNIGAMNPMLPNQGMTQNIPMTMPKVSQKKAKGNQMTNKNPAGVSQNQMNFNMDYSQCPQQQYFLGDSNFGLDGMN